MIGAQVGFVQQLSWAQAVSQTPFPQAGAKRLGRPPDCTLDLKRKHSPFKDEDPKHKSLK